jgi:hypothetical protein
MPIIAGKKPPLVFAIVCGSIGTIFAVFYQLAFMILGMGMGGMFQGMEDVPMGAMPMSVILGIGVAIMILSPLFILIGLYIVSAIMHLFLMVVRASGGGFEATFRVMGYATAAQLFNIIPLVGGFISGIWALVLMIIGLPKAHQTGVGRVIVAIFVIPILLVILLSVGSAFLVALLVSGS